MGLSIFKIFNIFGRVSSWADTALEDGKITLSEVVDLAEELAVILGVPLEIDIAPPATKNDESDHLSVDYTEPREHKTEA
jgi:hypothetical protein